MFGINEMKKDIKKLQNIVRTLDDEMNGTTFSCDEGLKQRITSQQEDVNHLKAVVATLCDHLGISIDHIKYEGYEVVENDNLVEPTNNNKKGGKK